MSWPEILIVALVALWLLGAVVFLRRHKSSGCTGCCADCAEKCKKMSDSR